MTDTPTGTAELVKRLEAAERERDRLAKLADKWWFRAKQTETKLSDANKALEAAERMIAPFAALAEWGDKPGGLFEGRPDNCVLFRLAPGCPPITLGDMRAARRATGERQGGDDDK